MKSKRLIVVMGSYGTSNLGDDLILVALKGLLAQMYPAHDLVVLGSNPGMIKATHLVTAFSGARLRDILPKFTSLHNADLFVLGGGGILQDNRSSGWARGMIPRLVYHALVAKSLGCRVAIVGAGIGPLHRHSSRVLVRLLLSQVDTVITRDKESFALVRNLGYARNTCIVASDLAFLAPEFLHNQSKRESPLALPPRPYLILSLRPPYPLGGAAQKRASQGLVNLTSMLGEVGRFVNMLIQARDWDVVFVPFDQRFDLSIGVQLREVISHPERITVMENISSHSQLLEVMEQAQATVGMRLHSLIMSYAFGKPIVPIGYDRKSYDLADQMGALPQLISWENIRAHMLMKSVEVAIADRKDRELFHQHNLERLQRSVRESLATLPRLEQKLK